MGAESGNASPTSSTNWWKNLRVEIQAAIIGAAATIIAALIGLIIIIKPGIISIPTKTPTLTFIASSIPSALQPTDTPTVPTETQQPILQSVEMILIPAGEFRMGNSNITPKDIQNVKPAHDVFLGDYYIDKYEVTNGAYTLCEKAGVCKRPYSLISFARPQGYYSDPGYANYPVIYVDWNMAKTYCEWRDARLPTEAEWEKAARGTSNKYFPWGSNKIDCKYARYGACGRDTSEVGIHPDGVSSYGIHDLAGNVWEWLSDFYGVDYYSLSPSNNPQGPATSEYHVARGGAWNSESEQLHVTFRNRFRPSYNYYNLGFRCAKSP